MPFAVLQNDLTAPTADQLVAAYKSVDGLAASDAIHVARYQFGVLAENLTEARANALASALGQQGAKVAVVDQSRLPALPPAKVARQLDCLPEALTVYDALGRAQAVTWDHVLLVAAGGVGFLQERKHTEAEFVPSTDGVRFRPVERHDYVETSGVIFEVLFDIEPRRVRTAADTLLFPYLGARKQVTRSANTTTVVADLLRLAPRALMNRGAAMLTQEGGLILRYQSRATFEKEMIWLLWWSNQPRT